MAARWKWTARLDRAARRERAAVTTVRATRRDKAARREWATRVGDLTGERGYPRECG